MGGLSHASAQRMEGGALVELASSSAKVTLSSTSSTASNGVTVGSASSSDSPSSPSEPPALTLSQLIEVQTSKNTTLTGLSQDSPSFLAEGEQEVQDFISVRKRFSSPSLVKAIQNRCRQADSTHVLCPWILDIHYKNTSAYDKMERARRKERLKDFTHAVKHKDFSKILDVARTMTYGELVPAVQGIRSMEVMEALSDRWVAQEDCSLSVLQVALGLRFEAEFPDGQSKKRAQSLYQRAFQCRSGFASVVSGYRLGLFEIWEKNFAGAQKLLNEIPEAPLSSASSDYQIRVEYWKSVCAEQLGQKELRDQLRAHLRSQYPLSLHALLTISQSPQAAFTLQPKDPEIWFRTQSRDQTLSRVMRDAELLIQRNQRGMATQLLRVYLPELQKAELPFQLYWAVVFQRLGERAQSFQVLAAAFRQDPQLITASTLKLMYPMGFFNHIQNLRTQMDPYLVLSLIRQESAFDEQASSPAGAHGLMQLQYNTARQWGRVIKKQLLNPQINLKLGVKYFKFLEKSFGGRIDLALAAYNAGPQRLKSWLNRYPIEEALLFIDSLPIQETRDYVTSIARNYYWYRKLYPTEGLDELPSYEGERLLSALGWQRFNLDPK
ncbi:MAG: lytic transglycosylase domain-containing protein [Bdellovibrionia bacterium]